MKTTRAGKVAAREAAEIIAEIDDQVRLEMLTVALLNSGWAIRTRTNEDGSPKALWAFKGEANIFVPFGDMDKQIVISRDADEDRTPGYAGRFDQETPPAVLLAVAEVVARAA